MNDLFCVYVIIEVFYLDDMEARHLDADAKCCLP